MTVKPIPKIPLAQRQFIVKTIEEQRRKKVANADNLVTPQGAVGLTGREFEQKFAGGLIRMSNPLKLISSKQATIDTVFDLSGIVFRSASTPYNCPRKAAVVQKINDRADHLKAKAMLGDPGDAEKLINNFIKWLPPKV